LTDETSDWSDQQYQNALDEVGSVAGSVDSTGRYNWFTMGLGLPPMNNSPCGNNGSQCAGGAGGAGGGIMFPIPIDSLRLPPSVAALIGSVLGISFILGNDKTGGGAGSGDHSGTAAQPPDPDDDHRGGGHEPEDEASDKWALDKLSSSGTRPISKDLTRAGHELSKHAGQGAFPVPKGSPSMISKTGQEQLDDILTAPGTRTEPITKGNFAGGRYYIAPDGRGAAFDPSGVFQYFGVYK
jgi:hypothetical protein